DVPATTSPTCDADRSPRRHRSCEGSSTGRRLLDPRAALPVRRPRRRPPRRRALCNGLRRTSSHAPEAHRSCTRPPRHAGRGGRQAPETWVITHGEPKANNTMTTATGQVLVDWDTLALAPPARDVWMTALVDEYTSITGRTVASVDTQYYRLHWDLKDL